MTYETIDASLKKLENTQDEQTRKGLFEEIIIQIKSIKDEGQRRGYELILDDAMMRSERIGYAISSKLPSPPAT